MDASGLPPLSASYPPTHSSLTQDSLTPTSHVIASLLCRPCGSSRSRTLSSSKYTKHPLPTTLPLLCYRQSQSSIHLAVRRVTVSDETGVRSDEAWSVLDETKSLRTGLPDCVRARPRHSERRDEVSYFLVHS